MSKEALAWLRDNPDAKSIRSAPQWAVMKEIAWKFDERRGYAWPGVSWLAEETRLARSTVQLALAGLEDLGWISRLRRDGTSNCYLMPGYRDADAAVEDDGKGAREPGTPTKKRARTGARESGTPVRESGTPRPTAGHPLPESRAQQVVTHTEADEKPVKADADTKQVLHPDEPATDKQLAYLRDIYILQAGALPPPEQVERDKQTTKGEADVEIKREWKYLEQYGPAYVTPSVVAHLSPRGQALYAKHRAAA